MKKILLFLIFLLLNNNVHAEIAQTFHYTLLQNTIKKADKDTLVIFDVHDVLLPTHFYKNKDPYRANLIKGLSKEKKIELQSKMIVNRKIDLLDKIIIEIFSDLKARKIPAIALTNMNTGEFGVIKKLEDWRINELQNLGINFASLSPFKNTVEFHDTQYQDNMSYAVPMLKKGIIFSAKRNKSIILERVFKHYNKFPKKIIYIDDKFDNLRDVEEMSKKYDIEFEGYIITKSRSLTAPELDTEREHRRFLILIEEGKWLSDEELNSRT